MNNPAEEKINYPVLLVIVIGTFMSILDGTIVNVALPKMIAVFNSTTHEAQWILTAYMLTMGVLMPISGYLGDRFGYKKVYIAAMAFFVGGSMLCGLSWNVPSMVASRVVQGLGGAVMQPVGMAILYQNFPREKMGTIMGIYGISVMAAPAIGPTLGGYLVDYVSWRFIFYINFPFGLACLLLGISILKETPLVKGKHFDYGGLISAILGFFCLLLALSQGNDEGWTSPFIVGLLFTSVLSLSYMVYHELNHPEPLMDMRLFKNFTFSLSVIVGALLSIGMFGTMFLFPVLLQNVLGQTAMKTGLIMFPGAIASGLMMPISGRLFDKYGGRWIIMPGMVVVAFATWMMTGFDEYTAFATMTFWITVRGFGMGFSFMPVTAAGMNTVPPHLTGRASALSTVIRQVSSAFGVAIFATIMQNEQSAHFYNLASNLNLSGDTWVAVQQKMSAISTLWGFEPSVSQSFPYNMLIQEVVKQSMVMSIENCLFYASLFCLAAVPLAFFFGSKAQESKPAPAAKKSEKDDEMPAILGLEG